ncbi:MAG: nuclear transport factor 2 family protein [Bacteroidaceae bacterium]|nr:nuclear transport factor 2 family protein [Bacteroidaceae bacterium]
MKKLFLVIISWVISTGCLYAQLETTGVEITDGLEGNAQLKASIEQNLSNFLVACNSAVMNGSKPNVKKVLTSDAQKLLNEMWKTSPMSCPVSKIEEICLQTSTGYQVRNVPVVMLEADEEEQDQELVFTFTPTGLIDGISISIDENKYKEIMDEHESVEDLYRRQVIVDFVENYRTSYNRKDLKYIESVFSDNALIITGKVIREKPKSDYALQSLSRERIVYQKRTKKEYVENLKRVFAGNKYINVQFDDVEVIQHPKLTDIYGVTLKQEWNSDRYRDVGFVFLMIDFQDELNPLIQVRTWQPEKLEGRVLTRDEVFSLGDFDIVRSLVND